MALHLISPWQWLAAGLVFLIPGCSVLVWLPSRQGEGRDLLAILADGTALSISIMALLAFWLSQAGIRVSAAGVILVYGLGLAAFAAGLARKMQSRTRQGNILAGLLPTVMGLGLVAGVIAWRFYQARSLALPAWVDSVHHVLVVRKIFEYGGIPPDLTPYLPAPFFYHYGFHLIAALFEFWTRQTAEQSVFWLGQVMNALVALSVYRAALMVREEIPGQPPAQGPLWQAGPAVAGMAAGLVGFAFQMPAYYVTWGRYTLLAGLVLLGPALAAAREILRDRRDLGAGIRLALLAAGLCLTHYFALLLYALFLSSLGIFWLVRAVREREKRLQLLWLAGWVGLGVLVSLPWVLRVAEATRNFSQVQVINPFGQSEDAWNGALNNLKYVGYLLGPRHSHILMGLAGVGLLVGLRRPSLRPLAAWAGLLGLLCLPWGPRFGPFRPDLYAIVLFFPASIFLADFLVSAIEGLSRIAQPGGLETPWFRPVIFMVLFSILAGWGIRQTRNVINSSTIIADKADQAALEWVKENTPANARFYINSVRWQGEMYRGVDGGYWLAPYTGRASSVPPALYGYAGPVFYQQVKNWAERSAKLAGCDADFWEIVEEAELSHLYLRQGKGSLQPAMLTGCPGVNPIYRQDGVFIYQVDPARK